MPAYHLPQIVTRQSRKLDHIDELRAEIVEETDTDIVMLQYVALLRQSVKIREQMFV